MTGPLTGIRVLALEQVLAGPYGSMVLGDLGAEVIKIEPPTGELIRVSSPPPSHKGESGYFIAFNRNKKSVVLDLMTETGREAFYNLVRVSDVVWDNNRAGVMARLRADYDVLKGINPKIICCSVTGYGPTGPYASWPSYDIIAQGMVGLLLQTGEPGGPPIKPAPALADISGALFGALGVVSALLQRERTGQGQKVETNLVNGAMALLSMHYAVYFLSGIVPPPVGAGHLQAAPFGAYRTKDGWITIGASWPRIARTLGIDWIIEDPRFATLEDRLKNRTELDAIITEALGQMESEKWLEILHADDIAAGPIYNLDQAPGDPQIQHNDMVLTLNHVLGGQVKLVGNPIKMPGIHPSEYTPPPTLGQHTHQVLSGLLGYSREKIEKLEAEQKEHFAELRKRVAKTT
ncbi:MAG TPA: CoA transferase [Dehalococcoidales bacterium]|nr:CoA transferase [Dehalococcoidales bacterium]